MLESSAFLPIVAFLVSVMFGPLIKLRRSILDLNVPT